MESPSTRCGSSRTNAAQPEAPNPNPRAEERAPPSPRGSPSSGSRPGVPVPIPGDRRRAPGIPSVPGVPGTSRRSARRPAEAGEAGGRRRVGSRPRRSIRSKSANRSSLPPRLRRALVPGRRRARARPRVAARRPRGAGRRGGRARRGPAVERRGASRQPALVREARPRLVRSRPASRAARARPDRTSGTRRYVASAVPSAARTSTETANAAEDPLSRGRRARGAARRRTRSGASAPASPPRSGPARRARERRRLHGWRHPEATRGGRESRRIRGARGRPSSAARIPRRTDPQSMRAERSRRRLKFRGPAREEHRVWIRSTERRAPSLFTK